MKKIPTSSEVNAYAEALLKKRERKILFRRVTALTMAVVMLATALFLVRPSEALTAEAIGESTATEGTILREADPSTMDTYTEMLDFSKDTRYAGRLWTDKSVFANGQSVTGSNTKRKFNGSTLELTPGLDGIENNGSVSLNSDFLEVFSALGSSLQVNESIPLDFMFVLDVSGSMGAGEKNGGNPNNQPGTEDEFNAGSLPINKTINALNRAIDSLLEADPKSRFGIVIYGSTAAVLVPLGHYEKSGETNFLEAGYKENYGTQGMHFSITATVKDADSDYVFTYKGDNAGNSNNEAHGLGAADPNTNAGRDGTGGATEGEGTVENPYHVGHITNPQAGLAAAMDQFITNNEETTFESDSGKTYSRIPALIHITDGQATDLAWIQSTAESDSADKWKQQVSNWNNVNWNFDLAYNSRKAAPKDTQYNVGQLSGKGAAAPVIFQTLMTAAYYKSAVNNYYEKKATELQAESDKPVDLQCYSIYASDNLPYESMPDGKEQVKATIAAILDPSKNFKDSNTSSDVKHSENLINNPTSDDFIDTAYELYKSWESGFVTEEYGESVSSSGDGMTHFELNVADPETGGAYSGLNIDANDVKDNIKYVQDGHFEYSGFDNISGVIQSIITQLTGSLFTSVEGQNDLGVSDSLTFMDPVGKYMEVKDVTNLALFGKLYPITKTAVYSYKVNNKLMLNENYSDNSLLKEGWYKGETESAKYYTDLAELKKDDPTITSEEDAWNAGWVYRLNAQTASTYVPSLADINSEDRSNAKMRATEYTFYIVDSKDVDINEIRINPAYGAETSSGESTPGTYKFSDLRIWVEDTGDYNDSIIDEGGLESDTGFDKALWINIPANMIPLRTVTLTQKSEGGWAYETNIPDSSGTSIRVDSPESASFPLRVFYEVGIEEDMLTGNGRLNTADVSAEYLKNNKIRDDNWKTARGLDKITSSDAVGSIEFFSNWYNPENRYGDYVTSNTDYSYGDPAATFAPSNDNQYYIFEKALPLYKAVYKYGDSNKWGEITSESYDGSSLDGEVIAVDLNVTKADEITNALQEQHSSLQPKPGDIVFLKKDRLTDVTLDVTKPDPFPSDNYYFLAPDSYGLTPSNGTASSTGTASSMNYCIARKGSEFGSAYHSSGIKNGDMLCWYDASKQETKTYPYHSDDDTGDNSRGRDYIGLEPSSYTNSDGSFRELNDVEKETNRKALDEGNHQWVVAAKPGGLRTGMLAQSVGEKTLTYTSDSAMDGNAFIGTNTTGPEGDGYRKYRGDRFPNKDGSFIVGYYGGNVTRTANNYYMPTISSASTEDVSGENIIVDVYLGNNGRLVASDTSFMLTKVIEPPEGYGQYKDRAKEFNFQVYIDGATGSQDAIVVKTEDEGKTWHRQINYADVTPDSKLFLLNADGKRATVDGEGKRVVEGKDRDGNVVYVYPGTENVCKDVYNVFIGANTDNGTLRVYQNPNNPDVPGEIAKGKIDEKIKNNDNANQNEGATYMAKEVWLFTQEQADSYAPGPDGSYMNENGGPVDQNDSIEPETIPSFELLKLSHDKSIAGSNDADITVTTDYAVSCPYWTQSVEFGLPEGQTPFDPELNNTGNNISEVKIFNNYGLLFTGVQNNVKYHVTEQIKDTVEDDFDFKSVEHKTGAGQSEWYTYTVGDGGNPQGGPAGGKTTANFGINGASDLNYYSVFNATDNYEQAAHYVNTYGLDALEIVKSLTLEDQSDHPTDQDMNTPFTFTVEFTLPEWYSGTLGTLHIWKGSKDKVSEAPPAGNTDWATKDWTGVESIPDPVVGSDGRTYTVTFTLTAEQAYIIYGLPIGTEYTVTETRNPEYPIENDNGTQDELYIHSGEIKNSDLDENNRTFTNVKPAPVYGELTVEKVAKNGKEGDEFTFTVTLDVPSDVDLNYTYKPNEVTIVRVFDISSGKEVRMQRGIFDELGEQAPDSSGLRHYSGEITIKGGQRFTIEGIPLGSTYTVTEESDPNYKLEGVGKSEDGATFSDVEAPDGVVSGTIEEAGDNLYYYKYTNTRFFTLPDVGGYSPWIRLLGALLLLVSSCVLAGSAIKKNKKR